MRNDRFLCIDDDVYHIGASIKDLGKKVVWFLQDGDTYTRRIGGKDQQRVINTQYFKNINIKNYDL